MLSSIWLNKAAVIGVGERVQQVKYLLAHSWLESSPLIYLEPQAQLGVITEHRDWSKPEDCRVCPQSTKQNLLLNNNKAWCGLKKLVRGPKVPSKPSWLLHLGFIIEISMPVPFCLPTCFTGNNTSLSDLEVKLPATTLSLKG